MADGSTLPVVEENCQTGFIKLYRSLKKHWLWHDAKRLKWWVTILFEVNHQPNKVLIRGTLYECDRGQSLNSLKTWSKEFRCNIQVTRTFFTLLENDKMIVTKGVSKTTLLTVCNYDSYNTQQHAANTQLTRSQHADNILVTTNKNDKNDKNDIQIQARKKNFYDSLAEFTKKYPKEMLRSFFDYWSEMNKSGKKMKWELQETFEVSKRLVTWASRDNNFTTNKTKFDQNGVNQQSNLKSIDEMEKKYK